MTKNQLNALRKAAEAAKLEQEAEFGSIDAYDISATELLQARTMPDDILALLDYVQELEKDAARYRWIIEQESGDVLYDVLTGCYNTKDSIDAAIDAATGEVK